jgi:phage portal protein BeeE
MQNGSNLNFWQSFFGFEWLTNQRFINQFREYNTRIFGQKTAVWIDTGDAFKHYVEIPELRAVVNKRASMMSANKPCLYDLDGNKIESHWFLDLIRQPNATQTWADVVFMLSVNDALFSNAFAYAPKRSFGIVTQFQPLPSDRIKIMTTGKTLKQTTVDGYIEKFVFCYDDGEKENLDVNDVVYLMTPDGINLINPSSRLESLKYPLSNIKASYHKRNVLLENIGAIGILSARNSDIGGAIPMTPDDKKQIQKDWYRRSKDELIITESDVNWQPMSYPTKDLLLFEELNADKLAIVDAFGLNIHVFSQERGATFSNVRDGLRMVYSDTIIPETQAMYDNIGEQLGLDKEGLRLVADFSHVHVLQENEEEAANVLNTKADALNKIQTAGVQLTEDEQRALLGL